MDQDNDNPWKQKPKKKIKSNEKSSPDSEHRQVEEFLEHIKEKIKNKETRPHDLFQDVVSEFKSKAKSGFKGGSGNDQGPPTPPESFVKKGLLGGIAVLALWLSSGIYMIQEGDHSAILRFGKFQRVETLAGLSYRLPWPFETNIIRRVEAINQIDGSARGEKNEHTLVLTGDENMIHVNYSVFWKIKDLSQFLFTNRKPEETIREASESAIREIIGTTTARLALTSDREKIGPEAKNVLQTILDYYGIGVEITDFQLQMVEPPAQVIDAFNDMQASLIDANRMENDAQSYANSVIPNARGESVKMVQEARSYGETVTGKARGEASQFMSIYEASKKNSKLTKQRLYLEGLEKVYAKLPNKTLVDGDVAKGMLPHLALKSGVHTAPQKKD